MVEVEDGVEKGARERGKMRIVKWRKNILEGRKTRVDPQAAP